MIDLAGLLATAALLVTLVALFTEDTHCPSMYRSTSSFPPGSTSWFGPVVQYVLAFA